MCGVCNQDDDEVGEDEAPLEFSRHGGQSLGQSSMPTDKRESARVSYNFGNCMQVVVPLTKDRLPRTTPGVASTVCVQLGSACICFVLAACFFLSHQRPPST
jgi:hypothetical protein